MISAEIKNRKIYIALIKTIYKCNRMIGTTTCFVIPECKAVFPNSGSAVYADNMFTANLYSLVKPPGLNIGIITVIIIAAFV